MAKRHTDPYRLFKRGDIYHAYISFVSETGERIQLRETTGATSEQGAVQYCLKRISELQKKIKQQTSGELPSITLNDAFGRYFTEKAQYHSNPSNILTRLSNIKTNLGVTYLHEIDKQVLSNFVALRRQTVKNGTINRELSIISAIKNLADDFWEVRTNKANPLKFKLNVPAENIKYFSDWETIERILKKASSWIRPIIYTALYTGFRRGTILTLKWENIDFNNNTITVLVKDKNTVNGKILTIPMIDKLKEVILKQPRINEYVFNYDGKPVERIDRSWNSIFYKWQRVDKIEVGDVYETRKIRNKKTGKMEDVLYKRFLIDETLPYTNFHTLRHTAMTWIVKSTGDIRVAQKIAGHADIKTTVKYAHVLDEQKRSALEKTFNQ